MVFPLLATVFELVDFDFVLLLFLVSPLPHWPLRTFFILVFLGHRVFMEGEARGAHAVLGSKTAEHSVKCGQVHS